MIFFHCILLVSIYQVYSEDLIRTITTTKLINTTKKIEIKKKNETTLLFCVKGFDNETCLGDGSGNKRSIDEIDCVFPFQYNGVWRDKCIRADKKHYWCSIDTIYANRSALCSEECPFLARKAVEDEPNNSKHTSCINSKQGVKGHFPNAQEIKFIVSEHNRIRSEVIPSSVDMRAVTWSFSLARLAQRWAESAIIDHDCMKCRQLINNRSLTIGQNGFFGIGMKYNGTSFWHKVISSWENEKKDFTYGDGNRVGCGSAILNRIAHVFCNYANAQIDYIKPYENGTSCTMCSKVNCKNKICRCVKACQNHGVLDPLTCTCACPDYAAGAECENLICSKNDTQYGCYKPNDIKMCQYENAVSRCPHLCSFCSVKKVI